MILLLKIILCIYTLILTAIKHVPVFEDNQPTAVSSSHCSKDGRSFWLTKALREKSLFIWKIRCCSKGVFSFLIFMTSHLKGSPKCVIASLIMVFCAVWQMVTMTYSIRISDSMALNSTDDFPWSWVFQCGTHLRCSPCDNSMTPFTWAVHNLLCRCLSIPISAWFTLLCLFIIVPAVLRGSFSIRSLYLRTLLKIFEVSLVSPWCIISLKSYKIKIL